MGHVTDEATSLMSPSPPKAHLGASLHWGPSHMSFGDIPGPTHNIACPEQRGHHPLGSSATAVGTVSRGREGCWSPGGTSGGGGSCAAGGRTLCPGMQQRAADVRRRKRRRGGGQLGACAGASASPSSTPEASSPIHPRPGALHLLQSPGLRRGLTSCVCSGHWPCHVDRHKRARREGQ